MASSQVWHLRDLQLCSLAQVQKQSVNGSVWGSITTSKTTPTACLFEEVSHIPTKQKPKHKYIEASQHASISSQGHHVESEHVTQSLLQHSAFFATVGPNPHSAGTKDSTVAHPGVSPVWHGLTQMTKESKAVRQTWHIKSIIIIYIHFEHCAGWLVCHGLLLLLLRNFLVCRLSLAARAWVGVKDQVMQPEFNSVSQSHNSGNMYYNWQCLLLILLNTQIRQTATATAPVLGPHMFGSLGGTVD